MSVHEVSNLYKSLLVTFEKAMRCDIFPEEASTHDITTVKIELALRYMIQLHICHLLHSNILYYCDITL